MKNVLTRILLPAAAGMVLFSACSKPQEGIDKDIVTASMLQNIRLGDGVPMRLRISTRWRVDDPTVFHGSFSNVNQYDSLVLQPRQHEIASAISNTFAHVDSVFGPERDAYIDAIRKGLLAKLPEKGIAVKEIIIAELMFPDNYAAAKAEVGTKNQELERIRNRSEVDLENATAAKLKAEADGKVAVEQAKQAGELARMEAEAEKFRRQSEMARAETERQVAETAAAAEAKKTELLNDADVKKQRDLKNIDIEKQKEMDRLAFEKEKEVARICAENPSYASFLVNKELASKVQIAVLPTGSDPNVFGDLLKQGVKQR